jgi:tRNA U34 5-methylaminomethyl-2-thiouridine-forming methyltransferase MnmC
MTEQWMIRCEAMRLAKIAVKAEIRDRGLRLKDYEMKEITALAEQWFSNHKASVLGEATIGLLCADIRSAAQKSKARAARVSAVQKSGAK